MNKLLKFIRGEANLIKQHMVVGRPTGSLSTIFKKRKNEKTFYKNYSQTHIYTSKNKFLISIR